MDVITVDHLRKSYGDQVAVADVGFTVRRGEIFGLLGSNGAGKTTTVECLQGLRRADSGTVRVLGLDPFTQADQLRRRIGSQLQSSALPDRLRVGEAVALFAHSRAEASRAMDRWELEPLRRKSFAALSGGQKQRLFLALALLNRPEVVFLDELTTGLDPVARRATWDLIREVRDQGATVVLVTHFMEEAHALCDRVAIVDGGRVVALDRPDGLTADHGGGVTVTFSVAGSDLGFVTGIPGVTSVSTTGGVATVAASAASVVPVAAALASHGVLPKDFRTHHPTLEDVFLTTTGRSLR